MKFGSWEVGEMGICISKNLLLFLNFIKIIYQIKNNVLICNGFNK